MLHLATAIVIVLIDCLAYRYMVQLLLGIYRSSTKRWRWCAKLGLSITVQMLSFISLVLTFLPARGINHPELATPVERIVFMVLGAVIYLAIHMLLEGGHRK